MTTRSEAAVRGARRRFDRWSGRYEQDRRSRWLATLQDPALEALELGTGDRLLDVGCGTGRAVRLAAPGVESAVGLDVSRGMVERARYLSADIDNVRFVEGEAGALPFDDGSVTAVLCTSSFHHYPDPAAAAREMGRVLTPGGRLVIADPCADRPIVRVADRVLRLVEPGHVGIYRSEQLVGFLTAAGLRPLARRFLWERAFQFLKAVRSEPPV
ncbi:MAG: methyltransferase domain-containing protein [Actinomycetota bacterium]|nr:methyltransferase domain-containing protein [Actinomycetota bacterium]